MRTPGILICVFAVACADHMVGPSQDVPLAGSFPTVPSTFSEVPATTTDSRLPSITVVGDSVSFSAVLPAICGKDSVFAGAARDSVVITLQRTLLPLPCAFLLPDVRVRAAAVARAHRTVVVSVHTLGFSDTTRVLLASGAFGNP
jgi:hypothetical protein